MPFQKPLGVKEDPNQTPPNFIRPLRDKRALIGQNIVLECQIEAHPDPVVKWLKDGHNVSQCPDYQMVEEGKTYRLLIPKAQSADCGRFTVQAMNAAGIKQSTCMLIVAPAPTPVPGGVTSITSSPAPPQTPVGPSVPLFLKELKHQPMKPSAAAVLEARVVGVPVPQVEWLKDGQPLNNYRIKTEYNPQTGICLLTVPQLFAEDMGEYTCRANNASGKAESRAQIMPQEQYDRWFADEQQMVTRERKQRLLAAQRAQLQQQHQQQYSRRTPQQMMGFSPRATPSFIQRQLGQVQPAQHLLGFMSPASDLSDQFATDQPMPPAMAPVFRNKLRGLRLTEGTDAVLQCSVVGIPKPRIGWFKNGRPLVPSHRWQTHYSGTMALLKVSMMMPEDSGEYTMIAENLHGRAHSSARIEVYPLHSTPPVLPQSFSSPDYPIRVHQQQGQQFQAVQQPSQARPAQQQQQQFHSVQPAENDPEFRLGSPPKEQYHQKERKNNYHRITNNSNSFSIHLLVNNHHNHHRNLHVNSKKLKSTSTGHQNNQYNQSTNRQNSLFSNIRHTNIKNKLYSKSTDQSVQPAYRPQDQFAVYRHTPERFEQQHQGQQPNFRAQQLSVEQPKTQTPVRTQKWDFEQLLLDPLLFESETRRQIHPYLRPPEQAEYYLQEQLRRRRIREMAPPPAKKNGPMMNGGAMIANGTAGKQPTGVKPPQFVEMPKPTAVKPGEKAVFKAKATGQPVPELLWMSLSQPQRKLAAESKKFQIAGGKDGQSQLSVLNVQQEDLGTYACVASNAGGSFQAQFELAFPGSAGTATTKSVAGGAGAARQKFQSPAPEAREQVVLKRVDRTRQFTSAKRPHLEEEKELVPSKSAPAFSSQLNNQTLIEGQHAMLDLKFSPTDDPNLKVAWLLNGKPIMATQRVTTLLDYGYAVLEINPVTVFDHGEYTCVAVNTMGEARQSAFIEVLSYVPSQPSPAGADQLVPERPRGVLAPGKDRPNFHMELRSQELFVGQPLRLETKLTPISDPSMKVAFFLNGTPVQSNERVQALYQNGFALLSVAEVTEQDAGFYVFQAENDIGTAETSATVVVVARTDEGKYLAESEVYEHDVEDMRELKSIKEAEGKMHVPQFVQPPRDFNCEDELGRSYFDARIKPTNDPSLRVTWLKDGQPLPNANRIQLINNFGFASLTIHPTYPEDAGVYSCVLTNSLGQAQADANLSTISTGDILSDPLHAGALPTIQAHEEYQVHMGPVFQPDRLEEVQSVEQPRFARPLDGQVEVEQEQPVHFECRVQPANDVKMAVHWLFNGQPLYAAHRFRPMFDFGYVALDILYAFPEDSGTYTCVAQNELGDAQTSIELSVKPKDTLYQDPLHPEGLDRIQELEQPKDFSLPEVPDRECDNPPKFLGTLQDIEYPEGDDLIFEIKLVPVNDPTMKVEWFVNDQPLYNSSRIHAQNDFGFITLFIKGVIPEDAGQYVVRATNEKGQAESACAVNIVGKDAILSAPQHEQSLSKIEYLEGLDKYPRQEIPDYEPTAPKFVQPLAGDLGEVEEGEPLRFECTYEPVGDNQLHIFWLRDGQPLLHASRLRTFHDFGYCSLDILSVYSEDSGTYTCVAENALGRAETSTKFSCEPKSRIFSEPQHPTSYARIQEMEAPKPLPEEVPEPDRQAPQFTKPLSASGAQVAESESVYLEAQYGPLDDNSIVCEWLFNGQPLMKAHRFVLSQDFGFAALTILYMYPEDSGTYTLVIRNAAGESASSVDLSCEGKEALLSEPIHPQSVARIAELEAPRPVPEEPAEPEKQSPQIVKQLTVTAQGEGGPAETQALHFDAQYTPTDDNTVKIEWFLNEQPLFNSNRHHLTNDFGYAALDINFLLAEDAGDYTLVVSNAVGQAQTSASVQIEGGALILEDTQHPESFRRIQELEAIRPAEPEEPELVPEAPQFTQELTGLVDSLAEGMPLHLDATVMPITDPKLRIEWFFNGQPLQFSSRIRTIHDFGYVALEFAHLLPSDSGTYTCRATNEIGEAESSITIDCETKRNLYLDSQHEQSWQKIQEIEGRQLLKEPSPELHFLPPTFIVPLSNFEDLIEGDVVRLECRLQPVNDPTLKVYWTCNEQPLPEGNRFMPARNLDLVTLDILTVYGEDSGLYSCRAVSDFGEAQTSATVKCQPTDALMLDTQHEQSWQQIQEIENRQPPEFIVPEPEIVAPRFVVPIASGQSEFQEGDPIHLEGQIEPTNDNQLVVEWFLNGQPLPNGHRFRKVHDFGYVSLDILYAFDADSGEYTCVARSELGSLFTDPQHEQSWQRIQELEAPKEVAPEAEPLAPEAPAFAGQLQSLERVEGQPAHFETRVTPVNDNKLRVQWFKDGQPLADSNRFAFTKDFGLIALDFLHTQAHDSGTYTVVATNEQGEARAEGSLTVQPVDSILGDTQHEQSWQRIQELEAPRPGPEEAPLAEHAAPRFTQPLNSQTDLIEGQPAHFEAQVEPIADPRLRLQWFHNGRPLPMSNRISMRNDFGLVTLDIHYVLAQDVGDYRCVAANEGGEASTEGRLEVEKRPGLLTDTMHDASWVRIQEMEAPREPPPEPEPVQYPKPQFTQPLQSQADVPENSVVLFEARVMPINDPGLQLQWYRNDQPLLQSNRYQIGEEFGHVWLRIVGAGLHDAGTYSCKAVNKEGAAMTNASLTVAADDSLLLNTLHEQSYQRIQELEAIDKNPQLAFPEMEFGKPNWTKTFENVELEQEGGIVQLIGHVEPVGDPNLKIEWFLNGVPLQNANRFRQEKNFGEVVLYILHVLPHDSGVYTCTASNAQGEATTSATVKVAGYEKILKDVQHPESWNEIQILEAPKIREEIEIAEVKEKPRFLTQLESVADISEGTPVRLEATFQPARDNDLSCTWEFNGHPLGASQLVRTRTDLGWAALDISAVNPDHEGVYTLKIANSEGEAASSASIKVVGIGNILGDTQHEESWRQIQILEAPLERPPSPPAPEYPAPTFQQQISDIDCDEGDVIKFEAIFMPNNDPGVTIQWVRNGVPLVHGSKYAIAYDFGLCTLIIGYTIPEDEGVYQLCVQNSQGEAITSATLKCNAKAPILDDVQHEQSWQRIQEIEAPKEPLPEPEPAPKVAPKFTSPVLTPGEVHEGQPAHFETTVEPIDDNELKIQWYLNGAPVPDSSRLKQIADFGWVILNINDTELRDAGDWECVAVNSVGEARASAKLNVLPRDRLLLEPINQSSLAQIEQLEAPRAGPAEPEAPVFEAPTISAQLQAPAGLSEGDSAHLEAHFTPVADPKTRVEWYKDGQPIYHSNRHRMVNDFGFGILDILYLLAHDSGEYQIKVINDQGEASSSVQLEVAPTESLLLQPQSEQKAKAVGDLEERLAFRPTKEELVREGRMPVFVAPLSAPSESEQGERAHFTARYEPMDDNQLKIQWFLNNKPLLTGSRVKTINEFGVVVLEIYPVYPEDTGDYVCKAINKQGEAVTSTSLKVTPKEGIEAQPQIPQAMAGAQQKITQIEAPKPPKPEEPAKEFGAPNFVSQLPSLPQLREGALIHLDAKLEPTDDTNLRVEWYHNGELVLNTNRMKTIHDFGFVVLELCPAEPQDNGTWLCRAINNQGQAETQCQIEVVGDSGISYDWVSPGQRQERIEELDNWVGRPPAELAAPAIEFGAPSFTEQLKDAGELQEAQAHAFLCVLEPIGDPSMHIEWQHNGHSVPYSNRIHLSNDFGVITLMIKHLIAQDAGEYKCIARNAKGEASTAATIEVQTLIAQEQPVVQQSLVETLDAAEGESVHLECRVTPINDPQLQVYWLKNGQPLPDANRYVQSFEFGFITLDILFAIAEDGGDYELVAVNAKGEARTKTHINVTPKPGLLFQPQAPGSQVVDNLEHHLRQFTKAQLALTAEDAWQPGAQQAPVFKAELNNIGVEEGDFCRFETQLAPINDPYMKVEWYKNTKPVDIGARFRNTLDSGYCCLDLLYALPDDTGEYACVATNQFGQAMLTGKLACSGKQHVLTTPQIPQGLRVKDVRKNVYHAEAGPQPARQKQKPQFLILPRNAQVEENMPARFECAVEGNPRPKVIWYVNGHQALHGHRCKLNYDGVHYLTISHARISDAGTIEAIARNTEGEVQSKASLDVFQHQDFRQHKLREAKLKTVDELQNRAVQWQRDTLGQLGEVFEKAPKGDVHKLAKVELQKAPIEQLETEELVQKFTRTKDEQYYNKLAYVEKTQKEFPGLELEPVQLKAGEVSRYQPVHEKMETVKLRELTEKEAKKEAEPLPDWASGEVKLGEPVGKATQGPELEREPSIPHRDQVKLKTAKPKPATEAPPVEHVTIEEDRAKMASVKQGPPIEQEPFVAHKDQVQIKQQFKPKEVKLHEPGKVEGADKQLKDIPPVVKEEFERSSVPSKELPPKALSSAQHSNLQALPLQAPTKHASQPQAITQKQASPPQATIQKQASIPQAITQKQASPPQASIQKQASPPQATIQKQASPPQATIQKQQGLQLQSRPQPTKLMPSAKTAPTISQNLKPVQAEIGRSATFSITYSGDEPVTAKWFHNGKHLRSAFDTQIRTSPGESNLILSKLKGAHAGDYTVRLENVAGQCESNASLAVSAVPDRGVAPQFGQRVQDQRVQQGQTAKLSCSITGTPRPTVTWFKEGKQLPNMERYQQTDSDAETSLSIVDIVPPDAGVYECVAKNPAGEVRCKSRLNIVLTKTGAEAERGPKQEAPRFAEPIKPVIGQEGANAEFRAKYSGEPEPTIRWWRNNEPVKTNDRVDFGHAEGQAWLRISGLMNEDVAEYKCEAVNPVGKAQSVANLVLQPSAGRVIAGKPGAYPGQITGPGKFGQAAFATKAPEFVTKLNSINARQGENIKFSVEIDGNPAPTVQWLVNGKQISAGGFHLITQEGNKVSLEVKKVTPANAGTYTVQVRNQHGVAQSEAKLSVAGSSVGVQR
uniref:Ig-like domain-containing protein n=1 Tax=Globodera rostochiensis TaxID=31243 RepID=A0A914H0K8_GLORO